MSLRKLQIVAFGTGFACVAWFAVDSYARNVASDQMITALVADLDPNTRLWSKSRINAYRPATTDAIGVIRISAVDLEAPIVPGTTHESLEMGVGWLRGSAPAGETGNTVLAAHRDGFFRGLKDLPVGATIEIDSATGTHRYRTRAISIVGPEDVSVIQTTPEATLTLITCYPFYFVGNAPRRFVVHADLVDSQPLMQGELHAS